MDVFDDIFESPAPRPQARLAGGKFQPKAKARPKKETSALVPLVLANDIKEKAVELSSHSLDTAQLAFPVDVADDRLENSTGSCLATKETYGTEEALKKHKDSSLGVPDDITEAEKSFVGSIDGFQQEGVVVNDNADMHSVLIKPPSDADIGGLVAGHFIESTAEPVPSDVRISGKHENSALDPSAPLDAVKENPMIGFDIVESVHLGGVGESAKEVDSMLSGVDPLGDVLFEPVTSNARAGQKFRPKIKSQPRMGVSKTAASGPPNTMGRTQTACSVVLDSMQSVQSIEVGRSALADHVGSFLETSEILESKKHAPDAQQSDITVPDESGDWHSSFRKSLGENADIFSGLECFDDFLTQTASDTVAGSKIDMDVQHGDKFLTSMATHSEETFSAPAHGSTDSSTFPTCDIAHSQTCSDYHSTQDPVTFSEAIVSNEPEKLRISDETPETKGSEVLFDFETCGATIVSGQRAGKFQPKPRLRKEKEKPSTNIVQAEVESALPSQADHLVSFDNAYVHEGSVPEFQGGDSINYSSARYSDSNVFAPTTEIHGDAEPTSLAEATDSDGTILGDVQAEDDPAMLGEVGGKSASGEAPTESNPLRRCKSSRAIEGIEGETSSRQLRKRVRQLVDEPNDEAHDVDGSAYEPPSTSNRDENEDKDDDYSVDTTSRKKKAPRKKKETALGKEKPVRKRKKANEASDQPARGREPSKKFSHSTRRSKRRVDKSLLELSDDEINCSQLPIRDLILLAEHRERMAIKEALKLKPPQTNQSADNSLHESASRNGEEISDDDHDGDKKKPNSPPLVNYQSFITDKTPRTRWSKQDTELFYEAVRQFGTDFSMIQQLFPGRTRHQIKSKFKKEERQHPLLLSEAVTNRSKGHSHFESVIERLQQVAAQKKPKANGDESIDVSGEEEMEEFNHNFDEGATKGDVDDEVGKVEEEEEEVAAEVHDSPLKSEESGDDDPDRWSHY
ncbi:hypothetical protein UlMin_032799 [Ulmus minor]